QQADSAAASSAEGNAAEQPHDAQQDAGSHTNSAQQDTGESMGAASSEPAGAQTADGTDNENQDDSAANPFARANEQLDAGEPHRQDGAEPDSANAPAENKADGTRAQAEERESRPDSAPLPAEAEALTSEEQLAAQQWLRRIPDDPGGLLRRKFLYQYRLRGQQPAGGTDQDW
ncbi:MAG: hypothetical protein WBO06_06350, partial [Gammaproteobacteria bacterium]